MALCDSSGCCANQLPLHHIHLNTKRALELLREAADNGWCDREAVETLADAIVQFRSVSDRVIDAAVTRWHDPSEEVELIDWLELSRNEYADWVQRTGIWDSDFKPYCLDDDGAVLRGCAAVRNMLILRIGDQHDHAQAFRDALLEEPDVAA